MNSFLRKPSKQGITLFFLYYRFLALLFVPLHAYLGSQSISFWLLLAAFMYNFIFFAYRHKIIEKLRACPLLMAVDVVFTGLLYFLPGTLEPSYYLYSHSSIFLGSFLYGYKGAAILAAAACFVNISSKGFDFGAHSSAGEHLGSYFFFYFLIAFATAYLSSLMDGLEAADFRKTVVDKELEKAKVCLRATLAVHDLSKRESEVFSLILENRSVEEISSALGISKNTAKTYMKRSYAKLGVATKHQAVSKVMADGKEDA